MIFAIPLISSALPFAIPLFLGRGALHRYFFVPYSTVTRNKKEESALNKSFQPLREKTGIRSDLQFRILTSKDSQVYGFPATCMGGNLTKYAAIGINQHFQKVDKEAAQFLIKHEFGHITHSHNLKRPLIGAITSTALAIVSPVFLGTSLLASIATCILSLSITGGFLNRLKLDHEAQADDFAIANSSNEELIGGIRLFKACRTVEKIDKQARPDHPTPVNRIAKIERELEKRGIRYEENSLNKKKITALVKFLSPASSSFDPMAFKRKSDAILKAQKKN